MDDKQHYVSKLKKQKVERKEKEKDENIYDSKKTINRYMQCRKRRFSQRQFERKLFNNNNEIPNNPICVFSVKGLFEHLPLEVVFKIMAKTPLIALGSLTLASKEFRNMILMYVYSKEGSDRVVPIIKSLTQADDVHSAEYKLESKRCHEHYRQLGVMLKRATCLFSTRERLAQVGKILDKLRDSHVKICTELGSDLAYSCYGIFLHAFIAGWEDEEKVKAFQAIKGASLLEERIVHVMRSKPGNLAGYERYVRVFCREIFLNRCTPSDKSFWMAQILKPYPICFQARLLYILYGPIDSESDDIIWDEMVIGSDNVMQDLIELSKGIKAIQDDNRNLWSPDDLISIFEEITTTSRDWDVENIALFLKCCGDALCCEVLGNKAINGRVSELAYLLYYIWQTSCRSRTTMSLVDVNKEHDWFMTLLKHIAKLMPRKKERNDLLSQMFAVWEECMIEHSDDNAQIPDSQESLQEEERSRYRENLRVISTLTKFLVLSQMDKH